LALDKQRYFGHWFYKKPNIFSFQFNLKRGLSRVFKALKILKSDYFLTACLRGLPGTNRQARWALTTRLSPVPGITTDLSFTLTTLNVPNPERRTFSPFFKALTTSFKKASTASREALLVKWAFLATMSTNSLLIIVFFLSGQELKDNLASKLSLESQFVKVYGEK
jgi:hypothetical protein